MASEINKAEQRKRFLANLDKMSVKVALSTVAGVLFDIQDFQETQNHNSTETKNRIRRIEISIAILIAITVIGLGIEDAAIIQGLIRHLLSAWLGI